MDLRALFIVLFGHHVIILELSCDQTFLKMKAFGVEQDRILYFSVYGAEDGAVDPEFLHIETIAQRAASFNGRIAAHAHPQMFQIVFFQTGSATVGLDNRLEFIQAPTAVCIPSSIVHSFTLDSDSNGWVLTASDLYIGDERYRQSLHLMEALFEKPMILRFQDNRASANQIAWTLDRMLQEYDGNDLGRRSMMEWMLRLILLEMRRQLDKELTPQTHADNNRGLFIDYCRLVESHYREHWSIARYANKLGIGKTRLNRLCQRYGGRTAIDLLQSRLTLEAQRHLIYTSKPAAHIAYALGFEDPAYFARFFKRRTGMTAGEYRVSKIAESRELQAKQGTLPSNPL